MNVNVNFILLTTLSTESDVVCFDMWDWEVLILASVVVIAELNSEEIDESVEQKFDSGVNFEHDIVESVVSTVLVCEFDDISFMRDVVSTFISGYIEVIVVSDVVCFVVKDEDVLILVSFVLPEELNSEENVESVKPR